MSRWSEIQEWERRLGYIHPDHDIELRRDERRKTTVSLGLGVIIPLLLILLLGLGHG